MWVRNFEIYTTRVKILGSSNLGSWAEHVARMEMMKNVDILVGKHEQNRLFWEPRGRCSI
jgi:hypothetical protein